VGGNPPPSPPLERWAADKSETGRQTSHTANLGYLGRRPAAFGGQLPGEGMRVGVGLGMGGGGWMGWGVVLGVSVSVSVKDGEGKKLRQKMRLFYKCILPSRWVSPLFVFMTCKPPPHITLSKKGTQGRERPMGDSTGDSIM